MKPTEREKKCIDYSWSFRSKYLEKERLEFKQGQIPLLLSPKGLVRLYIEDLPSTYRDANLLQKIILIPFIILFYLITFVVGFFVRLYEIITGDKVRKEKELELRAKYVLDDETSAIKTFNQFWTDKGLAALHRSYYAEDRADQRTCIYEWFSILYGRDSQELDVLVASINKEIKNSVADFQRKYPTGRISVRFTTVEEALPQEIDRMYGRYDFYEQESGSRDDTISALRNLFYPKTDEED